MKKTILLFVLIVTSIITKAQNSQWYPLGQGIDSTGITVASHGDTIYISGPFTSAFGFTANNFGLYVNGHGVNPGAGFTNGYANSFFNYNGIEYAGGTFEGYFRQFNAQTETWDSIAPLTSPIIAIDTFQGQLVLATDSAIMLYNTSTQQLLTVPKNFNGFLTSITVFKNKIWIAAYTNNGDTLSKLYTWDGNTIGDSALINAGIKYLYADTNDLFISGREINGTQDNEVAIYQGGSFSDLSDSWSYVVFNVGFVTNISGNPTTGYLFSGSISLIDGDNLYHPVGLYQNGNISVLGENITGTAYGACFNQDNVPITVGRFLLTDSSNTYNVVILGAATSSGIAPVDNKNLNLVLYPNPFHDGFTVKNVTNNSIYQLNNELGQVVATVKATGDKLIFNDAQLTAGVYVLKDLSNPQNVIQVIKQ